MFEFLPSELRLGLLVSVDLVFASLGHLSNAFAFEGSLPSLLFKRVFLAVDLQGQVMVNLFDLFSLLIVHVVLGFLNFLQALFFSHKIFLGLSAFGHFLILLFGDNLKPVLEG